MDRLKKLAAHPLALGLVGFVGGSISFFVQHGFPF